MSGSRLERLLFRRVPLWGVIALLLLAFLGTIVFANIAIHTSKGGRMAGKLGQVVLVVSDLPGLVQKMRYADQYLRINEPLHEGRAGFDFRDPPGTRPDAGYLLLSRVDGDAGRSLVEFWDLDAQKRLHVWAPDINAIHAASVNFHSQELDLMKDRHQGRMVIRHPVVTEDASLLIKSRTPLTKVDVCGEVVWINDSALFHHAVEPDDDGAVWLSSKFDPPSLPGVSPRHFRDDAITQVSADGETAFKRSVSALFLDKGMKRYVYGRGGRTDNPIHLNDVQPVPGDGPYWKRGDVFLSIRNQSMIVLYRPSTDEILWWQEGPWSHQHDVDVLDDHRISVFDNRMYNTWPLPEVEGHSGITVYDFDTGETSRPWEAPLAALDFTSETEGLHTVRPNGNLFLEEQNRGRLLELDPDGAVIWGYVNRAGDGVLYRTGWSRILEPEAGRAVAEAIARSNCPG